MNEENKPFPANKKKYTHTIGKLREEIVRQVIKEVILEYSLFPELYNIPNHDVNDRGADVTVQLVSRDKVIATIGKFEVTNWKFGSYLDYERAESIYNNLLGCPFKGLICTVLLIREDDYKTKELVSRIPVLQLFFQEVPRRYYNWYRNNNRSILLDSLKYSSRKTYNTNKYLIRNFLEDIGFLQYIRYLEANIITKTIKQEEINK